MIFQDLSKGDVDERGHRLFEELPEEVKILILRHLTTCRLKEPNLCVKRFLEADPSSPARQTLLDLATGNG